MRRSGPWGIVGRVWPRLGHRARPLNSIVIRHMIRAVRSYFLAMRASARFGRASKLRDAGKKVEALKVAREALAILSHPHVQRASPAEASVLSCTAVLIEELASDLNDTGLGQRDIVDALRAIRAMGPHAELAAWVPYLENRAARGDASAA